MIIQSQSQLLSGVLFFQVDKVPFLKNLGGKRMKTVLDFQKMKQNKEKIVMLTAYDAPSAKYAEKNGIDMILVGDSLGMVVLGYDSTIPVTLNDMLHHTKAVRRGAKNTFVVVDLPFMTYHGEISDTLKAARMMMQEGGANAIKLEGAGFITEHISRLTAAGVPVISHLGLTPQSVGVLGGYKVQGKTQEAAKQLLEDAKAVEAAGACMLLLECIPAELAQKISETLTIPTIGIGAGANCDAQVLVYHDLLNYGNAEYVAKFVKQFTDITPHIDAAIQAYVKEVKNGSFPTEQHAYKM